ncbi:MAG: HlyD family efflux transporter periplasmic adaptor subunit [Pirellulales bacterium]
MAATLGMVRLKPAIPEVDRSSIVIGTVERGTFLRQVQGPGTLVAQEVTVVSARAGGQVRRVAVEPGIEVQLDTVLLELWNPDVERAERDARRAVETAQADLERFQLGLKKELLDLRAATAEALASYEDARSQAEMHAILAGQGLIASRQRELSESRAERSRMLFEIQVERVDNSRQTSAIQLREKQSAVRRAGDIHEERIAELTSLTVRAGVNGILTQIGPSPVAPWQVGQRAGDAAALAIVINPQRLKAVLQIEQTQAREVARGQRAAINTWSAVIPGQVTRVDPGVKGGTVTVDIALEGNLPQGARPDLLINGTIEIERLENVLYIDRPAHSKPDSTVSMFRLEAGGRQAARTDVRLGRGSVSTIEVHGGLREGDQVIVSELPSWSGVNRISVE